MEFEQECRLWEGPITLHLVTINERGLFKNTPLRPHRHLFYELGVVLSGACEWRLGPNAVPLSIGEAILLPPGQEHAEISIGNEPAGIGWLGFDGDRPQPKWVNRPIRLGNDFKEIVQVLRSIQREHRLHTRFSAERIQLLLQNLLLLVQRQASGAEPQRPTPSALNPRQAVAVESAAHYFRQNLADCLSISQVAAYHSLSPTYFSSLFQQHHGVSPRTYVHHLRLEKSAELLLSSTLSIKEIARRCGFFDSAHFCKVFKNKVGQSPNAYRQAGGPL